MRNDGDVRVDLGAEQQRQVEHGQLLGPDARRYSRRTTRTKRKDADVLVAEGAPLVLFSWAGDQLAWFDGSEAREQWRAVRPHVTSDEPRRRGDLEWTVGRWDDDEGRPLLLLTGHC